MTRKGLRAAVLAVAGALALGGCAYDDYGYGGVSVGYGSGGYYGDPWYDGYGYPTYGWYDGYYYPGYGYYVYDRGGARHRWRDSDRRHWEGRRHAGRGSWDRNHDGRPDGRPRAGNNDGRPGWQDGRPRGGEQAGRPGGWQGNPRGGEQGGRPGWQGRPRSGEQVDRTPAQRQERAAATRRWGQQQREVQSAPAVRAPRVSPAPRGSGGERRGWGGRPSRGRN